MQEMINSVRNDKRNDVQSEKKNLINKPVKNELPLYENL